MLDDFDERDPHNSELFAPARADFVKYVESLLDEERGLNLRDGWVPCTHRWLVTPDGAVAGTTRLRHCIDTPFLLQHAGHVGYDVAPSHRGRGYGHAALRAALKEATRLGIPKVLLYTAEENAASRAVIERAGGLLESTRYSEFWSERECKYWISVRSDG
jgi:predicted acetyltransferase